MTEKFRFIRVSTMNGDVTGTNDEALACEYAESEDDFVVDTQENKWIMADGVREDIPEFVRYGGLEETEKLPSDSSSDGGTQEEG